MKLRTPQHAPEARQVAEVPAVEQGVVRTAASEIALPVAAAEPSASELAEAFPVRRSVTKESVLKSLQRGDLERWLMDPDEIRLAEQLVKDGLVEKGKNAINRIAYHAIRR